MSNKLWLIAALLGGLMVPSAEAQYLFPQRNHLPALTLESKHLERYLIGVATVPADQTLRHHLKLESGVGLVVDHVAPNSAAAKAGLQQHDVLVKVGEDPLRSPKQLSQAANASEGKPIRVALIRQAEPREVEVTPALTNMAEFSPFPGRPPQELLKRWMPEVERLDADDLRLRMLGPGVMVLKRHHKLPENLSVTIQWQGAEKATLTVRRTGKDGKEDLLITAREDELEKLPAEIRKHVEQLLATLRPHVQHVPAQVQIRPLRPELKSKPEGSDLQQEMRDMKQEVQALREALEALTEKLEK